MAALWRPQASALHGSVPGDAAGGILAAGLAWLPAAQPLGLSSSSPVHECVHRGLRWGVHPPNQRARALLPPHVAQSAWGTWLLPWTPPLAALWRPQV